MRLWLCGVLVCCCAVLLSAPSVSVSAARNRGQVKTTAQGDWVLTPFGWWPDECVHSVPSHSHVVNKEDHFVVVPPHASLHRTISRCATPPSRRSDNPTFVQMDEGDGWQQYVHEKVANVTSFIGQWTVPVAPTEDAQTLFTFTGLQNIDWVPPQPDPSGPFDIIQPVLQYGQSAAGGGDYWTLASWYVTLGSDVVYSDLVQVNTGDVIVGNMTRLDNDTWYINGVDSQAGVQCPLTISRSILSSQPWIYVTLEVYNVDDCGQYPPPGTPIPYSDLQVAVGGKPFTPSWSVGTDGQQPPVCGSSISVTDPSTVTIQF